MTPALHRHHPCVTLCCLERMDTGPRRLRLPRVQVTASSDVSGNLLRGRARHPQQDVLHPNTSTLPLLRTRAL